MTEQLLLTRQRLEARIEDLIALLDLIDGDCDLEDNADAEPSLCGPCLTGASGTETDLERDDCDDEENGDDEPFLGWSNPAGLRVNVPEERAELENMGWQL